MDLFVRSQTLLGWAIYSRSTGIRSERRICKCKTAKGTMDLPHGEEDMFYDQSSPGSVALESHIDLNTEDASTKEVTEAMWAGQSNILVAVRVRPLLSHDRQRKDILRVLDRKMVVVLDPGNKADVVGQMRNRTRKKRYAFDRVFEPEEDQQMVYNETTSDRRGFQWF